MKLIIHVPQDKAGRDEARRIAIDHYALTGKVALHFMTSGEVADLESAVAPQTVADVETLALIAAPMFDHAERIWG
jgi:hypothetical protein